MDFTVPSDISIAFLYPYRKKLCFLFVHSFSPIPHYRWFSNTKKSPGASLIEEVGSGLLAIVIHFNFACCCCQRMLSHGILLLSFSLVGVVVPEHTVAVLPAVAGHKERAARDTLISESP